jgi:hypothetical protein
MSEAPDIKVKLTAEDTGVSAAIKELTSQLKNLKKQQDETAGSGLSLKNAFEGIVVAAGALELGRIGKEAFDSAIDIGKMADKTGLSTQTLSVFHHVAEEVAVSTEGVDKALIKAARSITEFQQGSGKAALSFKALGITQKDFIGLKPDAMLALVTTRLGQMEKGFQKTTVAAAIFGAKAGTDIIPVANAIAGEGFDKITKSVSRLGLLLDQNTTDTFRAAKASLQELSDAGKGMATQFEAGMLPAISDVGDALLDALGDDGAGSAFRDMGKTAGTVIKSIAFGLLSIGATAGHAAAEVEEVFDFAFNHTKEFAKTTFAAIGGYITGGTTGAAVAASVHISTATDAVTKEFAARLAAIEDDAKKQQQKIYDALFPSDEEEKRRAKERADRLRPDKTTDAPPIISNAPTDAAAKAALSLLEKQLQDELAVHRAYAKQTEQVDKEMYDAGGLSLHEYFERRRAAVLSDSEEEIAIVQRGLEAARASVTKAEEAKKKADTPKDADKQEAARLNALAKVDELETKITELRVNSGTKIQALNDEQFKGERENLQKVLEFHREIDKTQGKTLDAAKQEIAIESQKMAVVLAQAGESKTQIDAEIAKYTEAKTAVAEYEIAKEKTKQDTQSFEIKKQNIEITAKSGGISPLEKERAINQLIKERLPLLKADAAAELGSANKTENKDFIADAQEKQKAIQNMGIPLKEIEKQISGALTQDFQTFFESVGRGTQSVAKSFQGLAASVLQSLSQIIEKQLLVKLFGSGESGGGGGGGGGVMGFLGSLLGAGHAEGGLIQGKGGPKSDSIPAMLSHGEYVVNADAVKALGVGTLDTINRGINVPAFARPEFHLSEGGLVGGGAGGVSGGDSNINLGISLDEGLIMKHLSSKAAGNIILQHLANNPKAAGKALSRSS